MSRNLYKHPFRLTKRIVRLMAMSKKNLLAVALISALLVSTLIQVHVIDRAAADPAWTSIFPSSPDTNPPSVNVSSPVEGKTYNSSSVCLNFTVAKPHTWWDYWEDGLIEMARYSVDGNEKTISVIDYWTSPKDRKISVNLTELSEGPHTLTVSAQGETFYYLTEDPYKVLSVVLNSSSITVDFSVRTKPPNIKILTLENNPGNKTETWLSFNVDEPISNMSYNLDGCFNVSVPAENQTLVGLSNGLHSIVFYATDVVGNTGASETLNLTIGQPAQTPAPSPYPSISPTPRQHTGFLGTAFPVDYGYITVATRVITTIVGISLLFHSKKRLR